MKRFLFLLLWLLAIPRLLAANPSYDSFNPVQFQYLVPRIWLNPNLMLTNVSASNIYTTTITNVYNVSSNVYTTNLWVTNLYATTTITTNLYVTNLYATTENVTNLYVTNLYANTEVVTNLFVTNLYASSIYATNLYVTNLYSITNFFMTNVTLNELFVTNLHVTNFYSKPVTINTNIYITNSYLLINGTNVATVNPTDLYVPARGVGGTNFLDTPLHLNAEGSSDMTLDGDLSVGTLFFDGLGSSLALLVDNGDGTAYITNLVNGTGALTNDGSGNVGWGTPTVPHQTKSLKFNFPRVVDNAGCTYPNTNDFTLPTFMVPQFSGTGASNANYCRFAIRVPSDIDTAVDLTAALTFELTGADTGAHTYHLGMVSIANSAAIAGTPANFVSLSFAGDASGASGDVESIAATTLTGWKSAVTAGQWWLLELRRDGTDASTVASRLQELEIFYTANQ